MIFSRFEEIISQQAAPAVKPEFIVEFGMTGEQILHAAHAHKADVIIMGLYRAAHLDAASPLPRPTAYQVVCDADCPVLILKN